MKFELNWPSGFRGDVGNVDGWTYDGVTGILLAKNEQPHSGCTL